jgi:predicted RNA-binding Zn-ribbon protein involved in translation (DUF1610 family)
MTPTRMATRSAAPIIISGSTDTDRMVTLVCASCRMALYMADRKLHMPTWKCPSCGAVTRNLKV